MKHILIISSSFPSRHDGSEAAGSFVKDFAYELSKYVKVTVVAPGEKTQNLEQNNLNIINFKVAKLPLSQLSLNNLSHWLSIILTMYLGYKSTKFVLQNNAISHIFSFWVIPSGIWAYLVTRTFKSVPYSCWTLGSDIWEFENQAIKRKIVKHILNSSYKCFADGIKLKIDIENKFARSCEFLPSCRKINPTSKTAQKETIKLAYLGRWHHNKGIDLLLDALELLSSDSREKINEIRIAGGGPLSTLVHQKCKNLSESKLPIRVYGYLDVNKATELITWADYLIIPSRIESIPVVLSDALQCNTPVIATPAGDLEDLITKYKIGILAKDIKVLDLKNAIETALNTSPSLFFQYINEAKEIFSLNSSVQSFLRAVQIL